MKTKKRILYVSQDITPYLPETPMGNISRYLPQGIQERKREIRTFMPRFGIVNERRNQLHEVIRLSGMNLIIDDSDHPLIIKVASIQQARMQVYFIDNEDYFHRKFELLDKNGKFFADNDERAVFFCRGVLETVKKLGWAPDLIHCHGWMTSLIPLYVKRAFRDNPIFADTKIVVSLYDDDFEEKLKDDFAKKIKIPGITPKDLKHFDKGHYEDVLKGSLALVDGVIQGSEKINPNVEEFARSLKVPYLEYQADKETYIDVYNDYYKKILGEDTE